MMVSTLTQYSCSKVSIDNHNASPINNCVTEGRTSVTFIMGTDKPNTNDFYKNATYFYNMHPEHKTDYVIHSERSLMNVIQYLSDSPSGKYYSTINIVCHGNPWQGLSVAVNNDISRATLPHLDSALKNNLISPLCSAYIDSFTKINIISCGVGQNKAFTQTINKLFSCPAKTNNPVVNVEKYYVNFTDKMQFRQSQFYFVSSKYDYNDPNVISGKLRRKYKDVPINWKQAYQNSYRQETDDPYKHGFRMMIEWSFGIDNKNIIPDMKTDNEILKWIKSQPAAMHELEQMQLKPEDFMWHAFPPTDQTFDIKIKGYGNVEGVMIDLAASEVTGEPVE